MIKKTFYNLPEEKRQRIINAVVDEFANAETDKVSINRIIQAANISRGSFYQYFDDKLDLVEVLMKSFVDLGIGDVQMAIANSSGDIFYTFERLYDIIIDFSRDERYRRVLKNLIYNMRASNTLVSDYFFKRYKGFDNLLYMTCEFSRSGFKFRSDEDMKLLQQILTSVLKSEIFNYYVCGTDPAETKSRYLRKLFIIKQGAVE